MAVFAAKVGQRGFPFCLSFAHRALRRGRDRDLGQEIKYPASGGSRVLKSYTTLKRPLYTLTHRTGE